MVVTRTRLHDLLRNISLPLAGQGLARRAPAEPASSMVLRAPGAGGLYRRHILDGSSSRILRGQYCLFAWRGPPCCSPRPRAQDRFCAKQQFSSCCPVMQPYRAFIRAAWCRNLTYDESRAALPRPEGPLLLLSLHDELHAIMHPPRRAAHHTRTPYPEVPRREGGCQRGGGVYPLQSSSRQQAMAVVLLLTRHNPPSVSGEA